MDAELGRSVVASGNGDDAMLAVELLISMIGDRVEDGSDVAADAI